MKGSSNRARNDLRNGPSQPGSASIALSATACATSPGLTAPS